MQFEYYIIYTLALVFQGHALFGQVEFERINASENWVLQFSDPCTENWQDNWFLDGKFAIVENSEAGMNFRAGPVNRNDAHHAVLWTKESFEGDIKIAYNYTRTDSQKINVNILYIQATGIGKGPYQKDIYQWNSLRNVPAMNLYFNNMKTLHISYAAYGTNNDDPWADYIRVRQYPVTDNIKFADIAIQPDFYNTGLFLPGKTYQITAIKTKTKLFFTVAGDGKFRKYSWDLNKPEGIEEGRIGLRHMYTRSATYRDFKVWIKRKK